MRRSRTLLLLAWVFFVSTTVLGSESRQYGPLAPKKKIVESSSGAVSTERIQQYVRHALLDQVKMTATMLEEFSQCNRTAQTEWKEVPALISVRKQFDSFFASEIPTSIDQPIRFPKPEGLAYDFQAMCFYLFRTMSLMACRDTVVSLLPAYHPNSDAIAIGMKHFRAALTEKEYASLISDVSSTKIGSYSDILFQIMDIVCKRDENLCDILLGKRDSTPLFRPLKLKKLQSLPVKSVVDCFSCYRLLALAYIESTPDYNNTPQLRLLMRINRRSQSPFMRLRFDSKAGWGGKNDMELNDENKSYNIAFEKILTLQDDPSIEKLMYLYVREDFFNSPEEYIAKIGSLSVAKSNLEQQISEHVSNYNALWKLHSTLQNELNTAQSSCATLGTELQRAQSSYAQLWRRAAFGMGAVSVVAAGAAALVCYQSGLFRQPVLRR